jgi:hypothetical protein
MTFIKKTSPDPDTKVWMQKKDYIINWKMYLIIQPDPQHCT